jgi:hypothetical protein
VRAKPGPPITVGQPWKALGVSKATYYRHLKRGAPDLKPKQTDAERLAKISALGKAWRDQNPEKERARKAAWRERNREHDLARKRAWSRDNPEKGQAYQATWRERNPEKAKAYQAAWRERNRKKNLDRKGTASS